MCLCKLTVGVTSTSAGRGGSRPVITLPGEAQEERGAGRPASPGSGGSEPGLCWEAAGSACSWAWTTALWPEPGMGMGSNPLPPFSCQPGETGSGEFIALRAVPWIFLTPSSWHPGPGAPPHLLCLWAGGDPSHPFACPESSLGPEEGVGHLFPFLASFLLCQGSRQAGQGFHPSFRLSWCHLGPPETYS